MMQNMQLWPKIVQRKLSECHGLCCIACVKNVSRQAASAATALGNWWVMTENGLRATPRDCMTRYGEPVFVCRFATVVKKHKLECKTDLEKITGHYIVREWVDLFPVWSLWFPDCPAHFWTPGNPNHNGTVSYGVTIMWGRFEVFSFTTETGRTTESEI